MTKDKYLIKDLENLTGIKAHTIRIWEQRYELLKPERTDTNIRFYKDDDLKKILNINLLYKNGYKISKIAAFSDTKLINEVTTLIDTNNKGKLPVEIDELITSVLDLNTDKINYILDDLFNKYGIVKMYQHFIKKFLIRIGELWQLNTFQISHEHLFSNTLRDFLIHKTKLINRKKNGKTALLFLPEKEEHELTLLFYNYLLKDKGWECIYLGQKVPVVEVESAFLQTSPNKVLTSLIKSTSSKQFKSIMNKLLEIVPKQKLVLSGSNTKTYSSLVPKSIDTIHSISDFSKIFH